MKKILKIIIMLLVVAAVVSAAGCTGKKTTGPVTPTPAPAVTPTPAVTNNSSENATGNATTPPGIHMNSVQRHQAIVKSRTNISGT
jgi:inhibitor of cysteine peptidase